MDLQDSLLRNKSQNFAVNIFEVTKFSTKHIFDEMSCIGFHLIDFMKIRQYMVHNVVQ